MARAISLGVSLAILWLLLSGYFHEPLLLTLGLISVVLVILISRRMKVLDPEGHPMHITWQTLLYWPWLVKEIGKSAIDVSRIVLSPRMPIEPSLFTVQARQRTDLGRVIFANSITLTPGTVTVALDGDVLTVHALTRAAAEGWEESEMNRRVARIEGPA